LYSLLTSNVKGNFKSAIFGNITAAAKPFNVVFKEKTKLNRIYTSASSKAIINQMAVAYGKTHPSPAEFSVTGPNGVTMYPITENNSISDTIRKANNG